MRQEIGRHELITRTSEQCNLGVLINQDLAQEYHMQTEIPNTIVDEGATTILGCLGILGYIHTITSRVCGERGEREHLILRMRAAEFKVLTKALNSLSCVFYRISLSLDVVPGGEVYTHCNAPCEVHTTTYTTGVLRLLMSVLLVELGATSDATTNRRGNCLLHRWALLTRKEANWDEACSSSKVWSESC